MTTSKPIPAVSFQTARSGASTNSNELGMRPMQERAYNKRGEQYLLIKSPPASGKSRALMFIALDKLHNQGLRQAIIVVPEKSIGGSFGDEPLSRHGFWADWSVKPKWNLCNTPGVDDERADPSKIKAVGQFFESDDPVLVCTHATFRFAVERFGVEAFDDRLIAVDEFHHVSAGEGNRLGNQLTEFVARDKVHIVAMTGSYFRGDAVPVLTPEDEAKFEPVTYTYYEQLNGYEHLKALNIGYFFYTGRYLKAIEHCLNPALKTIVHIPSVNARESTKDKVSEVNEILHYLGRWTGADPVTGFELVAMPDGRVLKIADLVDDSDPARRSKVLAALKDPAHKNDRDHVDIIIALGMAKEGFDWIWCEHALTVGYRSSLTEIIQIIGRATRDAPGKATATFTNLIAEPDASEAAVADAINDTLKAIAASLLMEQVLAPRFTFSPKNAGPLPDFNYGPEGYQEGKTNVGVNEERGQYHFEIAGLVTPKSPEAARICEEDLNEVVAAFVQKKSVAERGMFDEETPPQELTQVAMSAIVRDRYPDLSTEDQEAVRQHAIAALNLTQKAKSLAMDTADPADEEQRANTALLDGVRQYAMDVRELDIDLIDSINPWQAAYAVLAKSMSESTLKQVQAAIAAKRTKISPEEAKDLAAAAVKFKKERGRLPAVTSPDAWEQRLAEGAAAFMRFREEGRYE
ncbi:DNA helicase, restriction/modification system component YeeB [Qipengyuania citrea LAMA 915]|uniref:DNA helicase, restriction/modification system component YeeB n=1 Tax=Qipengyuania citrea LAMA 915 TaxID=1306953 RepID=A0A0L1KDF7_9SPHN|nr:DEAD/DEAH box helicase [Qipengyuania citrea]KNH01897.1 DNA helicase, restriction/modification system component YeeB [Qipengyuania citrea LAMA 915]